MNAHFYYPVRALRAGLLLAVLFGLGACSTLSNLNPFKSSKSDTPESAPNPGPAQAGMRVDPGFAGGRNALVSDDTSRVTQFVSKLQLGYVRIERIEEGAPPNEQPYAITAAQLRTLLEKLESTSKGSNEPIFNGDELADIAGPLSTALAKAGPREDVTFAVSGKHGAFFQSKTITTGRLFVKNGGINIIFNEIHGDFEDKFRATSWLGPFIPGSRSKPANQSVVASPGATYGAANRQDWIQLAQSTVPPAPTSRVVPGATGGSAAPADPYQDVERRLTVLKGLKDKGLITEQEYNDKRKEILQGL